MRCKRCGNGIDESEMDRYEVRDTSEDKKVFDLCAVCIEHLIDEWKEMRGNKFIQALDTYANIKPRDRVQELELFAFHKMTGEDVTDTLRSIDEKLADEYDRLVYGD
jgi:hypothetical protein